MKTIKNTGIVLGLGLLGVGTFIGSTTSASAAPRNDVKAARRDVKNAQKEVRQERKDLRRADTPGERRDAQQELRDAKRDVNREKRDLRDERQENRPGYVRPGYSVRPGYPIRPGYSVRPGIGVRPGYGVRPGVSQSAAFRTFEGTVTNDLKGNDFTIVTTGGQTVRVLAPAGEPGSLSRGDVVRVSGNYSGGTFVARNTNIIRNR